LHYRGVPIIAIAELPAPWSGYGNRYVSAWPPKGVWALNDAHKQLGEPWWRRDNNVFECLECRRWSVGAAWVFCSHRCRRAHRTAQARERRLAAQ
jgi:hypothetical protein